MITWTCHVCEKERPDHLIAVYSRDISERLGLPPGTVRENVRYCADRAECAEGAESVTHVKEREDD